MNFQVFFLAVTVDGSQIRRSPVEVGSFSMFFPINKQGFRYTSQMVVWDF